MTKTRLTILLPVLMVLTLLTIATGCNSSSDPQVNDYTVGTEMQVTRFYLKAKNSVMKNLDSVFFSIDVQNGLIYNADSLPVGTNVSALIPMITYPSTVAGALITMSDDEGFYKEVNYTENPSDSIDFTKNVKLLLVAAGEQYSKEYSIKVNVHKMSPDSLWWDKTAVAPLPSRLKNPQQQKTVSRDNKVWCMLCESDGSYTISSTDAINEGSWSRTPVTLPFSPNLRSLTATTSAFYMLSTDGALYTSPDCQSWSDTGCRWISIVASYGDYLQGIRMNSDGIRMHTQYPAGSFNEYSLEEGFPVRGASNTGHYTTKWSARPLSLIVGGEKADGSMTGHTWAFNGQTWCFISETEVPQTSEGTLIPYYAYLKQTSLWVTNEFSIWMYIGGQQADGTPNKKVYISFNNGVSWRPASQEMQLPEYIAPMFQMDHAIAEVPYHASFAPQIWRNAPSPFSPKRYRDYTTDGYEIYWNCPYIFITGGRDSDGILSNTIWRGVINRLSFRPII